MHQATRLRRAGLLLAAVASCALFVPGCVTPTGSAQAAPPAQIHWPARITAGLAELAARTPGVIELADAGPTVGRKGDSARPRETLRITRRTVCGCGIVLAVERLSTSARAAGEQPDEFVFVSFPAGEAESTDVTLPARISADDIRRGVRWQLYEPRRRPARGLVVHLGGNKYVRNALLRHGWAVLHSPAPGRFLLRRQQPQVLTITPQTDLETLAARIAAAFDDELADWPYALEAVLSAVAEARPDLPQRPLVLMGFSIGALGLPAVAARLATRCDAAVVVAGGANLLEISQRTSKAERGLELRWPPGRPTAEDWQRLLSAYLAHSTLDPYHTAPAAAALPLLVYQGYFDQVVPTANGELLYARLGRPRRIVYPFGHRQLLRWAMRLEAGRIVEWVEQTVGAGE